jgi:glycosyltransferase involved in cell wall biosynthesis
MRSADEIRLLIVQYAGNYRDAYRNLSSGGKETYFAQKYCFDYVGDLAKRIAHVSFICCMSPEPYEEVLENGVKAIGAGFHDRIDAQRLLALIDAEAPTHVLIDTMDPNVLRGLARRRMRVFAMLANAVVVMGMRARLRAFRLARALNDRSIEWVGSYGLTSSLTLASIGVSSAKIIPWDFLIPSSPGDYQPKSLQREGGPAKLIYVGALGDAKGVSDLLEAVALLHRRNVPLRLTIVGRDASGRYAALAKELRISDLVDFAGVLPTEEITPRMHEADVVVVPSRHDYPEGFPLVIHHALCARTPLVVSDHPMFRMVLRHEVNAMMFPARDAKSMAEQISRLLSNADLYRRLSEVSYDTWHRMRLPVKWADLIEKWLFENDTTRDWFAGHSMASGRYSVAKASA